MTIQTLHIRRRTNGTIDIDHYRNRALMERRETARHMAGRVSNLVRSLVAAVAQIFTQVLASALTATKPGAVAHLHGRCGR